MQTQEANSHQAMPSFRVGRREEAEGLLIDCLLILYTLFSLFL